MASNEHLSSQFGGPINPSDSEPDEIELEQAEDPYYTPERTEQMRERYGSIVDPNYGALRRARAGGGAPQIVGAGREMDITSPEFVPSSSTDSSAFLDFVEKPEELLITGEQASGEGAPSTSYGESESYERPRPAIRGTGMGDLGIEGPGLRESPFTRIQQGSDRNRAVRAMAGTLMLKEAGRCDAPGCQLLRATGLALTGQTQRGAGSGIASNLPPIPSVATTKRFYPTDPVTGKQDRKNAQEVTEVSPANPKDPEWLSLTNEAKTASGSTLFFPEDALAHHHEDEGAHLAYVQQRISGLLRGSGDYGD